MAHRHSAGNLGFRNVFLATLALLWERRKPLCLAILSFALLVAVVSSATNRKIQQIEDSITLQTNLSWQQLHDRLSDRMETFNRGEAELMMARFGLLNSGVTLAVPTLTPDNAPLWYVLDIAPWIFLSILLNVFIVFVALVFFLLLAGTPQHAAAHSVRLLPLMTLKMIGLSLWFLVRSLLWIPLVGPFLALYMSPRLVLAPAVLASGSPGVFLSFRESMKLTKGRWFFVALSLLALLFVSILVLWFCIVLVAAIALFSAKLSFFFWLLSILLIAAMKMFFLVKLREAMA